MVYKIFTCTCTRLYVHVRAHEKNMVGQNKYNVYSTYMYIHCTCTSTCMYIVHAHAAKVFTERRKPIQYTTSEQYKQTQNEWDIHLPSLENWDMVPHTPKCPTHT